MSQKIIIDLHNGTKLVAEEGCDSAYPNEIYIGIMSDDDVFWQDLAVVREKYAISNGEQEYIEDKFEVLVYADENSEDYTKKFEIKRCSSNAI